MSRDELVEKMCEVGTKAIEANWPPSTEHIANFQRKGMSAALDVAVGELLLEPTEREIDATADFPVTNWFTTKDHPRVRRIFASRRAQLEKVKTPEERIQAFSTCEGWAVIVDFNRNHPDSVWNLSQHVAEIYRLGLIAKLKEQP